MLKPASTTSMDQDYVEYYPHIMFLHNKAELQDFIPNTLEMMKVPFFLLLHFKRYISYQLFDNIRNSIFQEFYNKVFANSRLQTHSGLDMSLDLTEGQLNLFLIPTIGPESKN